LANSSDWFDYESMSGQTSRSKLEHAFQLGHDRLNVDKLLDWQGRFTLLRALLQQNSYGFTLRMFSAIQA